MISKKQKVIRKLNIMLFAAAILMIVLGQYIIDSQANPSFFIYYYSIVALLTLIAFFFIIYDIMSIRKNLIHIATADLEQELGNTTE